MEMEWVFMDSQLIFEIGLLALSYVFGSIPFSVVFGRLFKGIDVREHGSGNPGGTNSIRYLGRKIGFLIVFFDGLKGGLIVLLMRVGLIPVEYIPIVAFGTIAAIGHVYSIFIGLRGGKAVASTAGLITGFNVIWAVIAIATFFIVTKISRYVSIGSTSIAVVMVLLSIIWGVTGIQFIPYVDSGNFLYTELPFFGVLMLLIIYRHKSNYQKIRDGIEHKISW